MMPWNWSFQWMLHLTEQEENIITNGERMRKNKWKINKDLSEQVDLTPEPIIVVYVA